MAIAGYNPWQEMNSLQRQLNRLFDDSLTPEDWNDFGNWANYPAAEITEKDDTYYLKLEVPGMEAKDLDIQVMADLVAIAGERTLDSSYNGRNISNGLSCRSETKSESNGNTRSEFRYGKFQRVITLPAPIQNTDVKAEYNNGILSLTLPKSEAEKNKVVKVNIGQENQLFS